MNITTLKIASWTIAGGHTVRSNRRFDYDDEKAKQWDKNLQVCSVSNIKIGNIHTQPLRYFNFGYHEEPETGTDKEQK